MQVQTLFTLIALGVTAGALGGIFGIGGGMILIPGLVLIAGMNQHEAVGTSLAVMLPPIGLFAAYNFYKEGFINIRYAMVLAAAFMVGSFFTSKIAVQLPENLVRKAFSVVFMAVSVKMFFSK